MNCNGYPTQEGSPYYNNILSYLEQFYDKSDVVKNLTPYFKLFSSEDAFALRDYIKNKIANIEKTQYGIRLQVPDLKLIRWKACFYKL